MAFANLFSSLPFVNEAVKAPRQTDSTNRHGTEGGGKKRKTQNQPGSYVKKRSCQTNASGDAFKDHHTKTKSYQSRGTESYAKERRCGQIGKPQNRGGRDRKGQPIRSYHRNQQQGKTRNGPYRNNGRNDNRGGRKAGPRNFERSRNNFAQENTKFMSQEFKEQNALEVDGRLLCRHFLFGRCIKPDTCQLEHVQGFNDLIKVGCKFYIQGFCTKGESCPYMHGSFPCKFFHRRGGCFQLDNCKFSHGPLTDVTEKLLEEAIQREIENCKLRQKSEQEALGEPANVNKSEFPPPSDNPDILAEPLRPSFYNSTDVEEQTSVCQNEEPHAGPEADLPRSPTLDQKEPVCYSVEAVLGPQLFKPLFSFSAKPQIQAPMPPCAETPSSSVNPIEAPYSVDAVLRSFKSVESSEFVPHIPTYSNEITYGPRWSQNQMKRSGDEMLKISSSLPSGDGNGPLPKVTSHSESSPKHPPKLKSHVSVLKPDFPSLMKNSSVGVRGAKSGPATSSVQTQVSETPQHPQDMQPNLKLDPSSETRQDFSQQSPFSGRFVGLTDGAMPKPACGKAPSDLQGFNKPKRSTQSKGNRTSNTSFLSPFASPLGGGPSPPPCRLQPAGDSLSISRRKASDVASPMPRRVIADARQAPQKMVSPGCSSGSGNGSPGDPSACRTQQGVSDASRPTVKSDGSVLKTLFVSLGPYQEDTKQRYRGRTSEPQGMKMEKSSTGCGSLQKKQKQKKKKKKKKKTPASCNQMSDYAAAPPVEQQTAGLCRPGTAPSEPVAPLTERHTQLEEGGGISGGAAVGLFKDLFRTLNSSAFD